MHTVKAAKQVYNSTWIGLLKPGFVLVKTWLLIAWVPCLSTPTVFQGHWSSASCWLVSCIGILRPFKLFRSFWARSVNLSTLSWASFLGSLPVLSACSFASNWQLPFLNQRRGENGRRNYFMNSLQERMLPDVNPRLSTYQVDAHLMEFLEKSIVLPFPHMKA